MTIVESMDYIAAYDIDGITLTDCGRNAAIAILEKRSDWTPKHSAMLARLANGEHKVSLKLGRLVRKTRLGEALELVRSISMTHLDNQRCKLRRKAHRKSAA